MKTMTTRLVASALIISFLVLPFDLSAKERRGADLVVTRLYGSQVSGELIAVKRDSLLLLNNVGRDESIDLADIKTVRIVKKSRAGLFSGIGGAAGAAAGVALGLSWMFEEQSNSQAGGALIGGAIFGAIGALSGLVTGSVLGLDSSFTVAGKREEVVAGYWDKLRAHSREGRLPDAAVSSEKRPEPAPQAGAVSPGASTPSRSHPPRGPRFKLSLSAVYRPGKAATINGDGSFGFPEEAPPEAGPFPVAFSEWSSTGRNAIAMGPVSLAYEFAERWSAEIEFFVHSTSSSSWTGRMGFTSSTDGKTYRSDFYHRYKARFSSFLLGLTYRPLAPSVNRRHVIEIGAAIGPAWVRGETHPYTISSEFTLPVVQKVAFSGRVQAGYDYCIVPALSMGFFVGYRFMETSFSGVVSSGTAEFFEDIVSPPPFGIVRLTEVALPNLPVNGSGAFFGLRLGIRI
jgi:hypothetical protein